MRIAFLTNEAPPHIYGGAGVHVGFLSREMAKLDPERHSLQILCFGDQEESEGHTRIRGIREVYPFPLQDSQHQKLFDTLLKNLIMAGSLKDVDIVHCHTWYTHLAGCLVKNLLGIPLVLTTHSLEPQRPWKEDQLGTGYRVSSWLEKTAYENADGVIAVSEAMKRDVQNLYGVPSEKIRVIHNGIDTFQYKPTPNREILAQYGIDPDVPFLLFVGRITPQKGILHLVNAIPYLDPGIQIVLCAGAPDTDVLGAEMSRKVGEIQARTSNRIVWICQWVSIAHLIPIFTHASVFVCPSIYEPFGLINLEAMACATPVVASAVGGILEVVVHGETGMLVPFEPTSPQNAEPKNPEQFSRDLAGAVNHLMGSPEILLPMKARARERVEKFFNWGALAAQTLQFYKELVRKKPVSHEHRAKARFESA
jgi:alpha-maltose-1-phosphate synthase